MTLINSYSKYLKVVDGFLNYETQVLQGLKFQTQSIPSRAYFSLMTDILVTEINYETFLALIRLPQDISPIIFDEEFLNPFFVPIFNIELFNTDLAFLGRLEDALIDPKTNKILEVYTTTGYVIELASYYLDQYKKRPYLILTPNKILRDFKKKNSLLNTRAIYGGEYVH